MCMSSCHLTLSGWGWHYHHLFPFCRSSPSDQKGEAMGPRAQSEQCLGPRAGWALNHCKRLSPLTLLVHSRHWEKSLSFLSSSSFPFFHSFFLLSLSPSFLVFLFWCHFLTYFCPPFSFKPQIKIARTPIPTSSLPSGRSALWSKCSQCLSALRHLHIQGYFLRHREHGPVQWSFPEQMIHLESNHKSFLKAKQRLS